MEIETMTTCNLVVTRPSPLMPGDRLPNGAIVLKMRGEIVLALYPGWQPWVTWRLDDDHNAYLGHYFETLARALEDFDKRTLS
jgi:hypothetical protein